MNDISDRPYADRPSGWGGLPAVVGEIEALGRQATGAVADVSDAAPVDAMVQQGLERFGHVDILVANAGIQMHHEDRVLHQLSEDVWDRTHDVNYKGQYFSCKYGLAQMVKQDVGGVVILIASITALSGMSPNVSYSSSKAGVVNLARHIAVHYGPKGIRANSISPGPLERTPDFDNHPDPVGRKKDYLDKMPVGRLGTAEDIAPFITFLSTDDASYASGANFVIDGGWTIIS